MRTGDSGVQGAKKSGGDDTPHSAAAMNAEDLEGIIGFHPVLGANSKEADHAAAQFPLQERQ